ncbi:MAG TPA: sugar ABC transporter permease [Clostridiaceae bacterium]|nr:sugar ABC transporter permease [Clostridiaceae bacterium]
MHSSYNRLEPRGFYWFLYTIPALLVYIFFMAYPLLDSIRLSMYSGTYSNMTFVGLENFRKIFFDSEVSTRYVNALLNTVVFFLYHMLVQNVLGIIFAVLLTQRGKERRNSIYQTIIFIPTTLAILVTGYLWKLILNPVWSKNLLDAIGLSALAQPWLGKESTALTAVSLVSCWQWVGIPMMMFVAALRNISEDIFEAANIEGANRWQVFWRIQLPLIKPVVGIVAILTFVNNFNAFDVVFAMETANGAPGYSTDILGTLFYRVGIAGQHPIGIPNPGLGAAIATITFLMLIAGVIPVLLKTRTKE